MFQRFTAPRPIDRFSLAVGLCLLTIVAIGFAQGQQVSNGVGKKLAKDAKATASSEGSEPGPLAVAAVKKPTVFDYSAKFVPVHELPVLDPPTNVLMKLDAAEIANRLQGISVTPDGKVETLPIPEVEVKAFRNLLEGLQLEKKEGDNENVLLPESVIGPDTRTQITNTTSFPYRTAGRIDIGCTGTLIGPRHVLTAGHCVYNISNDKWYTQLDFSPGQNGSNRPYGTIKWARAVTVNGWTKDHDRNYDYAMIVLNNDIGNVVGTMGFGYNDALPAYNVNINGYPGDKPFGTMWHSFGKITIRQPFRLYHDCDTFGGNSGSGVYVYLTAQNQRTIYGIHAYGVDETGYNGATRINKSVFDNLQGWIAKY